MDDDFRSGMKRSIVKSLVDGYLFRGYVTAEECRGALQPRMDSLSLSDYPEELFRDVYHEVLRERGIEPVHHLE